MIDKSTRQHYAMQGKVRRIGFKRGTSGAPGGGDPGMSSGGGGTSSGGGGGWSPGVAAEEKAAKTGTTGPSKDTAKEKAIRTAAKTVKTKAPTRHHAVDTPTQKKEQKAIDKQTKEKEDWGFQDVKAKPKVPTVPKKAAGPFDYLQGPKPKTETTTVHGKDDQVFTITRPTKFSPTYHQDRSKIGGQTWGERAEDDLNRGFFDSGIGKFIKTALPFAIPALLPTKLATPYRFAKLGLDIKNKKGIVGQAINQALTSDLASKIGSNISTSNLTGKTTATDTRDTRVGQRDERDGRQITPEAPKDVVTASVEKFTQPQFTQPQLTELQRKQSILQGYADKGALNERGQSTLMQMNQFLEKYLVSVAHGGFIDKPLMGRSRDI